MSMTDDYPKAPEGTTAAAFFDSMKRLGMEYAGATHEGGRFQCPHPGHEDDRPSCDVTMGRKGIVLANCKVCEQVYDDHDEWWAECKQAGVRTAGVNCANEDIDWGERAAVTAGSHRVKGDGSERVNVKTITYHYNHEDGKPNFRAYRVQWKDAETGKPDKSFFVKRYDRGGGWPTGFAEDTERTPWKLERFADWAEHHDVLYLVEGEKAAKALHRIKQPATTFQGGAAAPLTEGWVERYGFGRFKEVRVWPDADEAGVVRAKRLLADLKAAGVNAVAWGVTEGIEPKDDAFDVIRRGDFEKGHVLKGGDAVALAALNPLPVKPKKEREKPQEPLSLTLSDGTVLVSAGGAETAPRAVQPIEEGDEPDPYPFSVNVEPYRFAGEMIDRHFRNPEGTLTLRFRHDDRTFWLWNERARRYRHLSDDDVKAITARLLSGAEETGPDGEVRPVKVKTRVWNDIVESMRLLTLTSEHGAGALLPATGGIPFRNGWLNGETGELLPIGPERDVRWNVPEDYDPKAECPQWIEFLESCGFGQDTDEYRLLRQWFGYLLSGSKAQEKALLLIGQSRAGKGVTIRVAEAMLGEGAVATSLDSLTSNFGLQAFIGKGLATIPDARFGRSDKGLNARLLSLTSNDSLPVDVKYGKPLSLNLGVRVMVGTNETPNFIEASDALARRFLVLRYGISHGDNPDPTLYERLVKEIPGIARWALGGLRDLAEEGKFVETKAGAEVQEQMILNGSYIRLFVEECCEFSTGAFTTNENLGKVFNAWAEDNHVHPQSSTRIAMMLSDAFPARVGNDRRKVRGSVKRGKTGIAIRKEYRFYAQ